MKLYHTSRMEIREPDVRHGRSNADFGPGFYLTPDQEFAFRWGTEGFVVNEYELDLTELEVRTFTRTEEWFAYIFHNRRGKDGLRADVVIGPIANDTIFDTLGMISSGFLSSADALKLLRIGPEYTQVALKTDRAASGLKWIRASALPPAGEAERKKEQDAYQKLFAEALEKIMESQEEDPCKASSTP